MGLGDELMAAGEAYVKYKEYGMPVSITDVKGNRRWHPLWEYCEGVSKNSSLTIRNAGHCRPYIDYTRSTNCRWYWKQYIPQPARLKIKRTQSNMKVLVESTIKQKAPSGKQWGRWQELVDNNKQYDWVQIGDGNLKSVEKMETPTLLDCIRVVSGVRAAIVPEGFLHHLCASLGVPCVVLFGGYISPRNTGYMDQENLWTNLPGALGWRIPHRMIDEAWKPITPERVIKALECKLERS